MTHKNSRSFGEAIIDGSGSVGDIASADVESLRRNVFRPRDAEGDRFKEQQTIFITHIKPVRDLNLFRKLMNPMMSPDQI